LVQGFKGRCLQQTPLPLCFASLRSGGRAASRGERHGAGMLPAGNKQGGSRGKTGLARLGGAEQGKRGTGIPGWRGWGNKEQARWAAGVGTLPTARRRCSWGWPYQDHFSPLLCAPRRGSSFFHYCLLGLEMRSFRRSAAESRAPRRSCKLH